MVWCLQTPQACIPQYSQLLSPLETATTGQNSSTIINWTEELSSHFSAAQKSFNDIKAIVIPSPSDILIITTDGASSNGGTGSILYVLRGVMHVGGFFFQLDLNSTKSTGYPLKLKLLLSVHPSIIGHPIS